MYSVYPNLTVDAISIMLKNRFADGSFGLKDLPPPSALKDMDKATKRIAEAIRKRESIYVLHDYDTDGTCSGSILSLFFRDAAATGKLEKNIVYTLLNNNRFSEGYGLNPSVIGKLSSADLVITVDNGISSLEASKMLAERGIDLIVTDHHIPPAELPVACAIIDQKQEDCSFPCPEICGAQVAWYLAASLNKELGLDIDMRKYLPLVTVAVIGDMMPLNHGINRAMVAYGLKMMERTEILPLKAFMEHLNKTSLTSDDIAFQLSPIINSAGRMLDASFARNFLLSKNIYDARSNLAKLIGFNEERKDVEKRITEEAIKQVNPDDKVIVIAGDDTWHEGVLGIAAARIARLFNKPAIVVAETENGDLKGSGRSFSDCNLFEITEESRHLLTKMGGHHSAVGLSLLPENFEGFKQNIQKSYLSRGYTENMIDPDILGIIDLSLVGFELSSLINQYEPYGHENARPKFISREVAVTVSSSLGKLGNHRKFLFDNWIEGVMFNSEVDIVPGTKVDIVYQINENHFRGKTSLQLMIEDIRIP